MLGQVDLGDEALRGGLVAIVVEDDLQVAEHQEVAVLVLLVHGPALHDPGPQREHVRVHQRAGIPAPARIVELADAAAVVDVRDRVAEGDAIGQLREVLPRGRQRVLPRGRTLGGSSSTNAMIYIRGNRADYDGWAAMGFDGWGWDDVLPYFLRSEDNERGAGELHGTGGPLAVSDNRSRYRTCEAFVEAGVQAGLPASEDFNGPEQDGVGWYQVTQRDGMRCSAAGAYLHPAMERANLVVETDAHVTRVLLEGTRAVGGELDQRNELRELGADRE